MKTLTLTRALVLSLLGSTLTVGTSFASSGDSPKMGTLNVTVVDENGAVVPDAPVYIYGEHKTHFVGGREIPGSSTFTMPAGEYRISSALVKKMAEYTDRFSSHEAHIQVAEGDNTTVILTLRSITDATSEMTFAELHRIGVPSEVAQNFN